MWYFISTATLELGGTESPSESNTLEVIEENTCAEAKLAPISSPQKLADKIEQVALLWQRDRATRLSVEILQLQNILFEN